MLNLPKATSKLGMTAICECILINYVLHHVYYVYRLSPY